jgi:hypothetical protein
MADFAVGYTATNYILVGAQPMAKRTSAIDSDPILSWQRTADLLKQLRRAKTELRGLKTYIAELEKRDIAARVARRLVERGRAS